ncbi:MAG: DUF2283 domain-containing protein [Candidatus Omnitrophica bacterium]|nr:DUF2283 domain-containing protein [Candidatus Omnitrophota bacterium]
MRISYDAKVDALYVRFTERKEQVTTVRLNEDISVNQGPKGEIVGIEILSAHEHIKFSGKKPFLTTENLIVTPAA